MKYDWDPQKNEWLKENRNVSFEQAVFHLGQGDVWRTAEHPTQKKYPGQKLYFIVIDDYIHIIPYVIGEKHIFLKTIIPSRKATKDYLKDTEGNL
jgi:uncharacterized DUF497 family protein